MAVGNAQAGPTPQMSLPGLAGERKKVGLMSPKPNSPPVVLGGVGLPDDGLDDAGDEHPVRAELRGDDGLDVEDVLRAVVGADGEVGVVLEGNADEAGDGVLRGLGEGFGVVGGSGLLCGEGCGEEKCCEKQEPKRVRVMRRSRSSDRKGSTRGAGTGRSARWA